MNNKKLQEETQDTARKLGRRKFLELAGKGGVGAALASASLATIPFLSSCKGETPTGPSPTSRPVTLQFDVYNHTQGPVANFVKDNVMSSTNLSLSVASLIADYGISNVDAVRIALRKDNFGTFVKYSNTGMLDFTVPDKSTNYDIFLFNNSGMMGSLYDWMESQRWPVKLLESPNLPNLFTVYRKDFDGQTGEERVWGGQFLPEIGDYGVFDQLNNVLSPPWASFRYGGFNRKPDGTSGEFGYGFGNSYGHEASPAYYSITVNSQRVPDLPGQVARGMAMVLERIVGWNELGGQETYKTIQSGGVLHQLGKDITAYFFVSSPLTVNV